MIWTLIITVIGYLCWKVMKYYDDTGQHASVGMLLPDKRSTDQAKNERAASLLTQLRGSGLMGTTDTHGFTLPHVHMPLSVEVSSTSSKSVFTVSGKLPPRSALKGLSVVTGYHTDTKVDAPAQLLALFDQGGVRGELLGERGECKLAQCKLAPTGELHMTVHIMQTTQIEAACAWLNMLQDTWSRSSQDWLAEMHRRTRTSANPESARQAMAYLYTWHPEQIEEMLSHAHLLDEWAHVELLAHVYADQPMGPRTMQAINELLVEDTKPPDFKVHAMNLCLSAPATTPDHKLFSQVTLAMLTRITLRLDEAWFTLLTAVRHERPSDYYTQSDVVMSALCEVHAERVTGMVNTWLAAPWTQLAHREDMLTYAMHHRDEHSELGLLGVGVLCWRGLDLLTTLTASYLMTPLLTTSKYLVWEGLILHRKEELAEDRAFLEVLVTHVMAKRQRHGDLTRLLVTEMGNSSHMPELLARLLPATRPETREGWARCAALVVEHLGAREDLIELLLELLPFCPEEDAARRVAARLPMHDPRVETFLIGWPLTARSVRHQLIAEVSNRNQPLSAPQTRAFIDLLTDKKQGPSHAAMVLAILQHNAHIQAIKWLLEARLLAHTRPFHKELDHTIDVLKERFAAQGGELSLSVHDPTRGALTLGEPDS